MARYVAIYILIDDQTNDTVRHVAVYITYMNSVLLCDQVN